MNSSKNRIDSFWLCGLGVSMLAVIAGMFFFSGFEVLSIAIGCLLALVHVFLFKRMAAGAFETGVSGRQLYMMTMLKSTALLLLSAVLLAVLFVLGWLKPIGFIIGFTLVMLTVFFWGVGRLVLNPHGSL